MLRREKLWVQHLDTIGARGWAIDQARTLGAAFYVLENLFYRGMALGNNAVLRRPPTRCSRQSKNRARI
jgi:hypothetical protein